MPGLWICLIILNVRQAFEDALSSEYARVRNIARLYMQGLHRVRKMSEYGSIYLNNARICLNVPKYGWTCLNIAECPWICPKKLCQGSQCASSSLISDRVLNMSVIKYASVLNMLPYNYNNLVNSQLTILSFLTWVKT